MKRISAEVFRNTKFDENVTAIRIEDGEIYFLAWFEDTENYNMVLANKPILLDRSICMLNSMVEAVCWSEGWQRAMSTKVIATFDRESEILEYINPYIRNGKSNEDDYEIFIMSLSEWQNILDSLRDGDYIIILNESPTFNE